MGSCAPRLSQSSWPRRELWRSDFGAALPVTRVSLAKTRSSHSTYKPTRWRRQHGLPGAQSARRQAGLLQEMGAGVRRPMNEGERTALLAKLTRLKERLKSHTR